MAAIGRVEMWRGR